jgi:hypothetical protein
MNSTTDLEQEGKQIPNIGLSMVELFLAAGCYVIFSAYANDVPAQCSTRGTHAISHPAASAPLLCPNTVSVMDSFAAMLDEGLLVLAMVFAVFGVMHLCVHLASTDLITALK